MAERLVKVKTNEKHQLYLEGADGRCLRLPGKEYKFITLDDPRDPTEEEMAYLKEHIMALFLEASMYSSTLNPPKKL